MASSTRDVQNPHAPCHVYLGGTFDPLHNGHIRLLIDAAEELSADSASFVPCHIPVHKDQPGASSQQRQAMLGWVVDELNEAYPAPSRWRVEPFELERDAASYTWHTVKHLRERHGPKAAVVWLIGLDSLASLDQWYRWQELLDYVHIGVFRRPGVTWPEHKPIVTDWWLKHKLSMHELAQAKRNHCFEIEAPLIDIASTRLRELLAAGRPCLGLLPSELEKYIKEHNIY